MRTWCDGVKSEISLDTGTSQNPGLFFFVLSLSLEVFGL